MLPSFTICTFLFSTLCSVHSHVAYILFQVWGASFSSVLFSLFSPSLVLWRLRPLLHCFHSLQWCVATAYIYLMWAFFPRWDCCLILFGIESENVAGWHNFGWSLFSGPTGRGGAYAGTGEWCRGGGPWCSLCCILGETQGKGRRKLGQHYTSHTCLITPLKTQDGTCWLIIAIFI